MDYFHNYLSFYGGTILRNCDVSPSENKLFRSEQCILMKRIFQSDNAGQVLTGLR